MLPAPTREGPISPTRCNASAVRRHDASSVTGTPPTSRGDHSRPIGTGLILKCFSTRYADGMKTKALMAPGRRMRTPTRDCSWPHEVKANATELSPNTVYIALRGQNREHRHGALVDEAQYFRQRTDRRHHQRHRGSGTIRTTTAILTAKSFPAHPTPITSKLTRPNTGRRMKQLRVPSRLPGGVGGADNSSTSPAPQSSGLAPDHGLPLRVVAPTPKRPGGVAGPAGASVRRGSRSDPCSNARCVVSRPLNIWPKTEPSSWFPAKTYATRPGRPGCG